ncbi:hypothetical protein JYB87_03760 [Shewanella avicenniae]|uniref:Uncharacterized protein n=1 Tax=Shewanella avicenniae TaxID=2814294 RepID=A0ABX7QU56_9GAMM|nr:hypothetical protein [Shewanella avicenniae]QSX34378.1 hypothetical protein JYB87_03760 [Shewanella avicenniae]
MQHWRLTTAFLSFSMTLMALLYCVSAAMVPSRDSHKVVLNSDDVGVVQAHILTAAVILPETLSESFEPLEPRKRAKPQANYRLLTELSPLTLVTFRHTPPRYFMAPSRAPPRVLLG